MRFIFILIVGLCVFAMPVAAAKRPQDKAITNSQVFIKQHPDILYRLWGLEAYKDARYIDAFTHFKRAAKYADKPSQGMIAEMLWKGEGVPVDRIQAYAWIDLAAERSYPTMVLSREKMWSLLSDSERSQAITKGKEIYKYYGDDVAKKRLELLLSRERRYVTGSRAGFIGSLLITIDTPSGQQTIDGSFYYQDKFWKPDQYWEWQDTAWKNPPTGNVEIGPLQTAPSRQTPADLKNGEKKQK